MSSARRAEAPIKLNWESNFTGMNEMLKANKECGEIYKTVLKFK